MSIAQLLYQLQGKLQKDDGTHRPQAAGGDGPQGEREGSKPWKSPPEKWKVKREGPATRRVTSVFFDNALQLLAEQVTQRDGGAALG